MSKKIYVGNFPYTTTEDELRELFESHGTVHSLDLIRDRRTGRSRGFGFVEMPNDAEAQAAINALNGTELGGRVINVNIARSRQGGRGGGGGGGGRRDGGGRRGGGGGGGGGRRW